jgi:N-acyl-D-aspartate/D-glutamate deacylase
MKKTDWRTGRSPSRAPRLSVFAIVLVATAMGCGLEQASDADLDLVIRGGRVMDPESGLDAIMSVGVRGGRIEVITEESLVGTRVIDAAGLVVAPGFVDLHEHGQNEEAYRLMVRDGVTTALELEVGTGDVAAWYAERAGGQIVNYGVSIGHIPARIAVMGDDGDFLPSGPGGSASASDEQIAEMVGILEAGLAEGAVAVGFGMAYTPGATYQELETMFRVAAGAGASAHIHIRGGTRGLARTVEVAGSAGVPLHVVHANSSAGEAVAEFMAVIEDAVATGQDVTTEVYPYGAGMTEIESALFDDWESWDEERIGLHQWVATGERLTRESFARYRSQGGTVIIHGRSEEATRAAVLHPLAMIASDGFIENGRGHPRTSGSYSKVLGQYVRDEGALSLMEALGKMTLSPAQRLEARTPSMRNKGRVRTDADADLVIFDPSKVIDRATYEDATIPSEGITYVIVNGVVVVDGGALVEGSRPGRAVRTGG